ncbi:MAG: aKG-HExxH-type peptide beta-hydroxylase, partial [Rubricella sp.]
VERGSELSPLIEALAAGEVFGPETFAAYYDLVEAILAEDEAGAGRWIDHLVKARPAPAGIAKYFHGNPADAWFIDILGTRLDLETTSFHPTDADRAAAFFERFDQGRALIAAHLPDLGGELDAILRAIAIGNGTPPDGARREFTFDGGSIYSMWGFLFLNAERHQTPLAMAEVLAHEAGHSFLFGFTIDDQLALNDEAERYASPLRDDPRPMEGIYHATFVSARMCYTMKAFAEAASLDSAIRDEARKAMDRDRRNFHMGHAVVAEHGRLSEPGEALMAGAKAWMDTL